MSKIKFSLDKRSNNIIIEADFKLVINLKRFQSIQHYGDSVSDIHKNQWVITDRKQNKNGSGFNTVTIKRHNQTVKINMEVIWQQLNI